MAGAMSPYRPDEAPVGVWLWVALIVLINAFWIGCDLWLRAHNHEFLTTEFKEGLRNTYYGPLILFLLCGSVGAFVWHMFTSPRG
jgi:hypothetical protein